MKIIRLLILNSQPVRALAVVYSTCRGLRVRLRAPLWCSVGAGREGRTCEICLIAECEAWPTPTPHTHTHTHTRPQTLTTSQWPAGHCTPAAIDAASRSSRVMLDGHLATWHWCCVWSLLDLWPLSPTALVRATDTHSYSINLCT